MLMSEQLFQLENTKQIADRTSQGFNTTKPNKQVSVTLFHLKNENQLLKAND